MSKETIKLEEFLMDVNEAFPNLKKKPNSDDGLIDLFEYFPKQIPKAFPYTFEEEVSQRGDGSGYESFYVFKRKSDGKYFTYYIYDGRIEENVLTEATKQVKTTWDFECRY